MVYKSDPSYPSVSESLGLVGGAAQSKERKARLALKHPEYVPMPALSARPLRNGNLWRTLALLGDQAAESEAKWPNSITAVNSRTAFTAALMGLVKLHNEFWLNESTREHEDAKRADELAEHTFLLRSGAIAKSA